VNPKPTEGKLASEAVTEDLTCLCEAAGHNHPDGKCDRKAVKGSSHGLCAECSGGALSPGS